MFDINSFKEFVKIELVDIDNNFIDDFFDIINNNTYTNDININIDVVIKYRVSSPCDESIIYYYNCRNKC